MIYLSTATSAQTFTFIPKKFTITGTLNVTDEETGLVQSQTIAINKLSNLGAITAALTLEEGKFYEVNVSSLGSNWEDVVLFWNNININWDEGTTPVGSTWQTAQDSWNQTGGNWDSVRQPVSEVIYNDRIFCTNQTISQRSQEYYDVIKDEYVYSTSGDNTYKVYNG